MTVQAPDGDRGLLQAELREASATGVEARLRAAGAGARAHAFMVDFYIRVALAFAWYAAGARGRAQRENCGRSSRSR